MRKEVKHVTAMSRIPGAKYSAGSADSSFMGEDDSTVNRKSKSSPFALKGSAS